MDSAPPIPDPPLLLFLASFEGAGIPAEEVDDQQMARWRAAEAGYQCAANAARYLQGRAIAARLEHIDHGDRLEWKDQIGEALSLARRSVELRVQIATALDELLEAAGGQSAALRRSLLDRPWREVLDAVKAALGQDEEEELEDDLSLEPEPAPVPVEDLSESRWTGWKTQLTTIEEETFDSLDDVEQWVQLLQDALERAEERREELADEVTEVPPEEELRERARRRRPRPGFVAPRPRSFTVSVIEPE